MALCQPQFIFIEWNKIWFSLAFPFSFSLSTPNSEKTSNHDFACFYFLVHRVWVKECYHEHCCGDKHQVCSKQRKAEESCQNKNYYVFTCVACLKWHLNRLPHFGRKGASLVLHLKSIQRRLPTFPFYF